MPPLNTLKRDIILNCANRKEKALKHCATGSTGSLSKTPKGKETNIPKRSSSTKSLIESDVEKNDPGFRSQKFFRQDSMNELNPWKKGKIGIHDQSTNVLRSNLRYESFFNEKQQEHPLHKMNYLKPIPDKSNALQRDKGDQNECNIEFGSDFFPEEFDKKKSVQKNKKQFNGEEMVNTHYLKVLWGKAVISVGIFLTNLAFICMGSLPLWVMIEAIIHMALYTIYFTHTMQLIKNYKYIVSEANPNNNTSNLSQSKTALSALFKKMSPDSFFGFLATGCLAACVIYSFFVASNMKSLNSENDKTIAHSLFVILFNLAMNITTLLTILVVAVITLAIVTFGVVLLCGLCLAMVVLMSLYAIIYFGGFFWVCFGTNFIPYKHYGGKNFRPSDEMKKSKQITLEFREKKEKITTLLAKYAKEYRFIDTNVEECVLCLDAFKTDDAACKLNCNVRHVFHEACLNLWVLEHDTCPLCKNEIDSQPKRPARKELEEGKSIFVNPIIKKRSKSEDWSGDSDFGQMRRLSLDSNSQAMPALDNHNEEDCMEVLEGGIIKFNGQKLGLHFSSDEGSSENLRQCGTNFSSKSDWKSKMQNSHKNLNLNMNVSQNTIEEENEELEQSSIYEDLKKADVRKLSKPKSMFKTQMVKCSKDIKKPKKEKKDKKMKKERSESSGQGSVKSDANPFDVHSDSRNTPMSSN